MGDKYILELEDKPFHKKDGDFLYRVKGFNSLVFDMTGIGKLTPYTEPDLEQVREEAYKNGYDAACKDIDIKSKTNAAYQKGLEDAWECARKICHMDSRSRDKSFGAVITTTIFEHNSASEAIEKIRQYEQEKEEKEEQKEKVSVTAVEVMRQYLDTFCVHNKSCERCPLHTLDFTCGRGYHFLCKNRVSDEEVRRAYAKVVKEK